MKPVLQNSRAMAWNPGQQLQSGKYTIDRILGWGGAGITYLARQQDARRDQEWVVIKTLKDELRLNPKWANHQTRLQQDFLNEALKLAQCRHPHVVQVKELIREETSEGAIDGLVMEYVQGNDLARHLGDGILPETEALRYIRQIGAALTVVHSIGLLHRDVKPQNIMLRAGTSEAVLIDFGLAREFMPDLTQTHTESRTEGFAPLEQYDRRAKRGAYTDVYALAATLYCLLTGTVPRPAPTRSAGVPLKSPKQHNPAISARVNKAILRGLELKPEDRPQSMQAWLNLLEDPIVQPIAPVTPALSAEVPSNPQKPSNVEQQSQPPTQRYPAARKRSSPIPWTRLAFVLAGYATMGAVYTLSSAPLWVWAVAAVGAGAVAGAGAKAWAVAVAVAVVEAVTMAVAEAWAEAWTWAWAVVGAWAWAWAGIGAVAEAWAEDKLLESCNRSHTFLILIGSSLAGLGLGGLIGTALRSSYPRTFGML
jgi:serine/threonine protein kinase